MQLHSLIYTSRASTKVTSASLSAIAESSARRNARVGITGLLLYGSGNYFQLLEGSQSTIDRLYRRIAQDNRHHDARILFEASIANRIFPDWHMGQLNLDEPGLSPSDFWDQTQTPQGVSSETGPTARNQAIAWVRSFMDQQGRAVA